MRAGIIASIGESDIGLVRRTSSGRENGLLADKIERFLKAPVDEISPRREAEAARFHREYLLLLQHRDYDGAVHALDAATALAPEEESWQREMVLLLPNAAIEILDPGGQNWARS